MAIHGGLPDTSWASPQVGQTVEIAALEEALPHVLHATSLGFRTRAASAMKPRPCPVSRGLVWPLVGTPPKQTHAAFALHHALDSSLMTQPAEVWNLWTTAHRGLAGQFRSE